MSGAVKVDIFKDKNVAGYLFCGIFHFVR